MQLVKSCVKPTLAENFDSQKGTPHEDNTAEEKGVAWDDG